MDDMQPHWHLDKRLNVGHILTTIIIAGSMFTWASGMEARMARLSTDVANIKSTQADKDEALRREMSYLRSSIDKLSDKLDRLIESK